MTRHPFLCRIRIPKARPTSSRARLCPPNPNKTQSRQREVSLGNQETAHTMHSSGDVDSSPANSDDEWVEVNTNTNPNSRHPPAGDWFVLEDGLVPKEEEIVLGDDDDKEAVDDVTESDEIDIYHDRTITEDDVVADKTPKLSDPLSGVFYRTVDGLLAYAPFGPDPRPLPDPALSFLPEPTTPKSSAGGLLCCRGQYTQSYYVCNPVTFAWTEIPFPANDHGDDVSVVLVPDGGDDYYIVCAVGSPSETAVYGFESFSSQCWAWLPSSAEWSSRIVEESGVATDGAAHWRTSMGTVLSYVPAAGAFQETEFPREEGWELGELGGRLCCTSMTGSMAEVMVLEDGGKWREERWLDVGPDPQIVVEESWAPVPLRSIGGTDLLFWVAKPWRRGWQVVAQNVETGRTRWLAGDGPRRFGGGGGALVPYLSSLAHVKRARNQEESAFNTQDLEALANNTIQPIQGIEGLKLE